MVIRKSRVFFAINFSEKIQQILKEILVTLQRSTLAKNVRWTPWYNLHITLGFLGNIQVEHISQLIANARKELSHSHSFALRLERLQWFPNAKRPRIISVEAGPSAALNEIAHCIRQAIIITNYPAEMRAYRGHLTLGRLRTTHFEKNLFEQIQLPIIPEIIITQIDLLESKPGKEVPCYIPLAHFNLK
ncbi:RNA 2',3'-cyclic phosphodiesterase [Legionella cardiaca]|uniref:RNA 2',3'-cyclic phosphodiesterase n=1 Tax=Legionella cardiaca TaxID=1071983 RepID=A0ABY8AS39_9GAMM|nr:RNA 2',3'-cyclic phosphodiesterase [Legionella cardiaca]WED43485.1 RNA 2',3'-cyclic phosphodiesterase [Legionella cardiaca]